jgi:hypothetical protein
MADNVTLNAGSGGDTIAADDIGGVKYQLIKLGYGALDSFTIVTSSVGLPVGDAGGSLTVDNNGTFAVQAAQSGTWNVGTVTTVTGVTTVSTVTSLSQWAGNAIDTNSGSKSAGTLRVVLATDQPALTNKLLVTPDLPSGASTAAKQPALGTAGTASSDVITVQGITSMTPLLATITFASAQAVTQSGTWNITNISGTVSLPTGASTAAKQPALGTAGSASTDVITIQGIASMTKLLVTPDANSAINVAQVGGSSVSTAASGVQKVGVVGNAGATVDSTVGAGTAPANQVVAGSLYNATAPAPTTGQAMALQADQGGNLRTFPGVGIASLSVWNSGTSVNATQTIFSNSGAPAALVHIVQSSGSFSAGAVTFEVTYDNSNWITISADAVIDPTSTTLATVSLPYTLTTSTNKGFLLLTKGASGLRIKLSTAITGTGTVTPNYALIPHPPVQQAILGAGSATIGALSANQSVNLAQVGGGSTATGHGTASGALRVELPTDGTGVLATVGTVTTCSTVTSLSQWAGTAIDTNSGNKSAGTLRVVLATDQPALTNKLLVTPDANSAVNISQMNGVTVTMGNGASGTGVQRVTIANDSTGVVAATQSGTWTVQPGNTANSTPWLVTPSPATSGGLSLYSVNSSGASNQDAAAIKGSAGQIYGYSFFNTTASARYVKLYNVASGATSASTPIFRALVPAGGGANVDIPMGIICNTGISIRLTTGAADSDTGSCSANDVLANVWYK